MKARPGYSGLERAHQDPANSVCCSCLVASATATQQRHTRGAALTSGAQWGINVGRQWLHLASYLHNCGLRPVRCCLWFANCTAWVGMAGWQAEAEAEVEVLEGAEPTQHIVSTLWCRTCRARLNPTLLQNMLRECACIITSTSCSGLRQMAAADATAGPPGVYDAQLGLGANCGQDSLRALRESATKEQESLRRRSGCGQRRYNDDRKGRCVRWSSRQQSCCSVPGRAGRVLLPDRLKCRLFC